MSPRPAGGARAPAPPVPPERGALDRAQVPGPLRVEPPLGRGTVERSPVPGRRPGTASTAAGAVSPAPDRYAERARQVAYNAAILVVASVVVGQLWGLTVALDAWMAGDEGVIGWILAFQAASFAVCAAIWAGTSRRPG